MATDLMDIFKTSPLSGIGTANPYSGFSNNADVMKKAGLQSNGSYGTFNMNDPEGFKALYNDHSALANAGGGQVLSKDQFKDYLTQSGIFTGNGGTGKYSVDANGNVTTPHDSVADTGWDKLMQGIAGTALAVGGGGVLGGALGFNLPDPSNLFSGGTPTPGGADAAWGVTNSSIPEGAASSVGGGLPGGSQGFNMLDPATWNAPPGVSGALQGNFGSSVTPGGWEGLVNGTAGTTPLADIAATGGAGSLVSGAGASLNPLQQILKGLGMDPSAAGSGSFLSTLGKAIPGILGAFGSSGTSDAYKGLADKYGAAGLPALARLEASYAPGFDVGGIPGLKGAMDTASGSLLSKLSATGGNPFGNPGGLIEANKQILNGVALPALSDYRGKNLQQAGLGMPQAFQADTAGIGANNAIFANLGNAANSVFGGNGGNFTLQDILKAAGVGGLDLLTKPV